MEGGMFSLLPCADTL